MNAKPSPAELDADAALEPSLALSEVAHKAMMGMLLSGELAPNEVVTERQIALQLGISRTPLREAVRRLEGERFLERQRNGALVVRALPIEEYMHILNVRRLVEGEAARLAAGRVAAAELELLKSRIGEALQLPEDVVTPEFAASATCTRSLPRPAATRCCSRSSATCACAPRCSDSAACRSAARPCARSIWKSSMR